MAHDRDRVYHPGTAVSTTHRTPAPFLGTAAPVERRTYTDARTHAKSVYERDGTGSEVYASYYNSNDDPTFQARYNGAGNTAFMTSSSFTVVSHGGCGPQKPQRVPTAIVEEASAEPDVEAPRRYSSRVAPTAQPIVEEPDDDDDDAYDAYGDDRQRYVPRDYDDDDDGGAYAMQRPSSRRNHHHHHHYQAPQQEQQQRTPSFPYRSDGADLLQLRPFAQPRGMAMMHDFFGEPHNPFGMMDAMRQHMSQQRAAMFGGVDPFASFF